MSSIDMCEHDWPGSGCRECFPKTSGGQVMSEYVTVKRELLRRIEAAMGMRPTEDQWKAVFELRAVLAQEAGTVEPIPITDGTNRLMEAYRLGEFRLEGGSPTVEAMSCASFDENPDAVRDCDFDSYTIGYQSALYEEAKSLLGLIASLTKPEEAPE